MRKKKRIRNRKPDSLFLKNKEVNNMATRERYINVQLGNSICVKLPPVYQYDHGLQLRLSGLPTDSAMPQVHFSCVGTKEAFTVFPSIEGEIYIVEVPDVLLMQQN